MLDLKLAQAWDSEYTLPVELIAPGCHFVRAQPRVESLKLVDCAPPDRYGKQPSYALGPYLIPMLETQPNGKNQASLTSLKKQELWLVNTDSDFSNAFRPSNSRLEAII